MNTDQSRPYLIIPKFIKQPTWGGDYILKLKGWDSSSDRIGQSYELSSSSRLAEKILNSDDLQSAKDDDHDAIPISEVEPVNILIKLNQAHGNSFQLHIEHGQQSDTWKPKPESWYFLEKGYISLGLNPSTSIEEYKKTCIIIESQMKTLSEQVQNGSIDIDNARSQAHHFIQEQNPWQFVNRYQIDQFDLIDLSMGGIHHSWEENLENTVGNVVYEVQRDVTDDESTMRSFDQGKIKNDGSIREVTIDDYFAHIDTDPEHNTFEYLKRTSDGNTLLKTDYYVLERYEASGTQSQQTNELWHHTYVQDGAIELTSGGTTLNISRGHSCFIPSRVESYVVSSTKATILVTHLP
ncbi:MAG: hypothetical protein Q8P72_05985 [Candidatus Roizmanbacteria bacterium]|nr:hypothetical protein [Candidatus Roizmanbacteria bacterium]